MTLDDEPRVLDTDLAQQLGMAQPLNVRTKIIATNREELESFGPLFTRQVKTTGRPGTAYYLNRQQALLVCILSRTPKAVEVRREVIRRFDAYEGLVETVKPRLPLLPSTPGIHARAPDRTGGAAYVNEGEEHDGNWYGRDTL